MHNLIGSFFDGSSSFCVAFVYDHCCRTNQNRSTMSLTSPVSCFPDDISFYRVSCFWIFCSCYKLTNQNLLGDESYNDGSNSRSAGTGIVPIGIN